MLRKYYVPWASFKCQHVDFNRVSALNWLCAFRQNEQWSLCVFGAANWWTADIRGGFELIDKHKTDQHVIINHNQPDIYCSPSALHDILIFQTWGKGDLWLRERAKTNQDATQMAFHPQIHHGKTLLCIQTASHSSRRRSEGGLGVNMRCMIISQGITFHARLAVKDPEHSSLVPAPRLYGAVCATSPVVYIRLNLGAKTCLSHKAAAADV